MNSDPQTYVIRSIRADEWPEVKALRLLALQDPVAHLAFLETYENALVRPDAFWQERAEGSSQGSATAQQIVALTRDGTWVGMLTVLMEEAGTVDWAGFPVERRQGHVVGVYVRPEHRGTGLTERMFGHAAEWAWNAGVDRVRLIVHEDNTRAQGLYRKVGFVPTGRVVPLAGAAREKELEFVLDRA